MRCGTAAMAAGEKKTACPCSSSFRNLPLRVARVTRKRQAPCGQPAAPTASVKRSRILETWSPAMGRRAIPRGTTGETSFWTTAETRIAGHACFLLGTASRLRGLRRSMRVPEMAAPAAETALRIGAHQRYERMWRCASWACQIHPRGWLRKESHRRDGPNEMRVAGDLPGSEALHPVLQEVRRGGIVIAIRPQPELGRVRDADSVPRRH
jgi:hypothetical protein